MTAHDYWFDRAEMELCEGAAVLPTRNYSARREQRKEYARELLRQGYSRKAVEGFTGLNTQSVVNLQTQLRATGATSGPIASSGSKEGRGQL